MRRILTAAVAATVLSLTAACGSDDPAPASDASPSATPTTASPSATEPETEGVTVEVRLTESGPEPQGERVEVSVGEPVTLVVTSEVEDEVHVHSDPEHSLDVRPGDTKELTFTIDRPGQVAVESHAAHATIVQLVVRP